MASNKNSLLVPNNPIGIIVFATLVLSSVYNPYFGILVLGILSFLSKSRANYGVLEKCGIPVVKPTLFLGSEPNIHKTVLHLEDIKRFKEHGGIWGSYVGDTPQIYVADPELHRLIFVKDFVHFADRRTMDFGTEVLNEIIDFQQGEKWKTLRTSLSPLFTTAKLKQMSDVIGESASEFIEDLKAECDGDGRVKFNCRKRLTTWLIDMFTRSVLGVQLEDCKNPDNKFAEAFRSMMAEDEEYNLLYSLSLSFPILTKLAPQFNDEPTKLIESTILNIMESRRKSGQKSSKDFLDVLIDQWDRVSSKEYKDLGITKTTIIAQAVNMFLGGYETSATTLSHLLLDMAERPEIQDKMYAELMSVLEEKESKEGELEIDHDLIADSKIPFITACINESLRLAPPLHRPERICTKDWNYKGVSIKKGTIVVMATWAANRHPEIYPDPDKYQPERFLPENKTKLDPYAFGSFGFGPRNCIGMRFAYENLKLFTCNFVKNFRVEKRADTELVYKPGSLLLVAFSKPLFLDFVKRE